MVAIVTRASKGAPLTNAEMDSNFTNLNDGKIEMSTTTLPSSSSIIPSANFTHINIYNLATNTTIGAPVGTPTEGRSLILRIIDDGTARSLNWDVIYKPVDVVLPVATSAGKVLYIGMIYNAALDVWNVTAVAQEV
jgi:hypothetical protein